MSQVQFTLDSKIGPLVCSLTSASHVYVAEPPDGSWSVNGVRLVHGSVHLFKHPDGWKAYPVNEHEWKWAGNVFLSRPDHKDPSPAAKAKVRTVVEAAINAHLALPSSASLLLDAERVHLEAQRNRLFHERADLTSKVHQLDNEILVLDAQLRELGV